MRLNAKPYEPPWAKDEKWLDRYILTAFKPVPAGIFQAAGVER
jgi:hypothetical protein